MRTYLGIVLVKKVGGAVLAQLRDDIPTIDSPNLWSTVGGLMESGDKSFKSGAIRELKDETGYIYQEMDLRLLVKDEYFSKLRNERIKRVLFWAWYDEVQIIMTNEGQEIRFLPPSELQTLVNFDPLDIDLLKKASEKAFFSTNPEKNF